MMTQPQLKQVCSPYDFERDWSEIIEKYHEAKSRRDEWFLTLQKLRLEHGSAPPKRTFREAVRNYNALRGVVKTLEWILSTKADDPLD